MVNCTGEEGRPDRHTPLSGHGAAEPRPAAQRQRRCSVHLRLRGCTRHAPPNCYAGAAAAHRPAQSGSTPAAACRSRPRRGRGRGGARRHSRGGRPAGTCGARRGEAAGMTGRHVNPPLLLLPRAHRSTAAESAPHVLRQMVPAPPPAWHCRHAPLEAAHFKHVAAQLALAALSKLLQLPRELAIQLTRVHACTAGSSSSGQQSSSEASGARGSVDVAAMHCTEQQLWQFACPCALHPHGSANSQRRSARGSTQRPAAAHTTARRRRRHRTVKDGRAGRNGVHHRPPAAPLDGLGRVWSDREHAVCHRRPALLVGGASCRQRLPQPCLAGLGGR